MSVCTLQPVDFHSILKQTEANGCLSMCAALWTHLSSCELAVIIPRIPLLSVNWQLDNLQEERKKTH